MSPSETVVFKSIDIFCFIQYSNRTERENHPYEHSKVEQAKKNKVRSY